MLSVLALVLGIVKAHGLYIAAGVVGWEAYGRVSKVSKRAWAKIKPLMDE